MKRLIYFWKRLKNKYPIHKRWAKLSDIIHWSWIQSRRYDK